MSLRNSLIVMKKDIAEFRSTKYIMFTLILMPLMFAVIVPVTTVGSVSGNITAEDIEAMGLEPVEGIPPQQLMFNYIINSMIFIFIIIPLATPSIIGSYSIVGEKINKSLEPLLATPIDESELLAGKILAGVVPAVISTILSFLAFSVIINFTAISSLGVVFFPGFEWFFAIFVLAPLFAFLSMAVTIILSSRMNDIRAVQQTGAVVVLPVMGLFMLSIAGQDITNPASLLAIALIVLVIDVSLFKMARKLFRRNEILTKWK